jgi:hypothetical protein
MVYIEQPQPRKRSNAANIFYFVMRKIELEEFGTVCDGLDSVERIELQLGILDVEEMFDAFKTSD